MHSRAKPKTTLIELHDLEVEERSVPGNAKAGQRSLPNTDALGSLQATQRSAELRV
jgi:hypothetical protein